MLIRVRLFARSQEVVGKAWLEFDVAPGSTVGSLRQRLIQEHPALEGLLARSRLAVHEEFAADTTVLEPGAVVAVLPPVSGG